VDQRWDQLPDPQRRDHIRTIHRQSLRMARLVRDVLAASEMDQGLLKVDPQPTEVTHVVEAVAHSHARGREDIRIHADGRPIALADPERLEQILSNLLANALRYGRPPVIVDVASSDPIVEIRVRDGGSGIPEDLRPRLFNRFELSAEAEDLVQQGFGLGLSVARSRPCPRGRAQPGGGHRGRDLPADASGRPGFLLTVA
jgi:signal transduction histidine kinase